PSLFLGVLVLVAPAPGEPYELGKRPSARASNLLRLFASSSWRCHGVAQPEQLLALGAGRDFLLPSQLFALHARGPFLHPSLAVVPIQRSCQLCIELDFAASAH